MAVTFSRGDLAMAKAAVKVKEVKERASVSRERRLALALRAVLDQAAGDTAVETANADAEDVLSDLGYADLVGIPKQVATLETKLEEALQSKDYAAVTRLGQELVRVRAGKSVKGVENNRE